MLFYLFVSWLLAGTAPGVLTTQPGSVPGITEPTNKPTPKLLPPKASGSAVDATNKECCGPDVPPPPRRPGDGD